MLQLLRCAALVAMVAMKQMLILGNLMHEWEMR